MPLLCFIIPYVFKGRLQRGLLSELTSEVPRGTEMELLVQEARFSVSVIACLTVAICVVPTPRTDMSKGCLTAAASLGRVCN
jgi:hypothetical protein